MINLFNKITIENLLISLCFLSLFFVLLFFTADFFTVYFDLATEKFIFLDERRIFLEQNILKLFAVSIFVILFSMVFKLKNDIKEIFPDKFMMFFTLVFIVYYLLNESQIRGMFFLGIILTIFLYDTFFKISQNTNQNIDYKKIQKIFIYVLCLYLLVPLLIHILHATVTFEKYFLFDFAPQLYIVDTFRGFTLDRVQYSFLSGIALILLLFNRKNIKYQKLLIYLLLFGLFISMARASLVALILAFTYYEFFGNIKRKTKKKFLFIIGVLVLIGLAYLFSSRMELFADGGNRIKIINDSLSMILNDGLKTLLFGYGEYYTTLHNGVYPHNSVLQTVLNFGLIITSLWLIMLWQLFTKLSVKSKVMFIYIFTFGLFHAGFSAFVFIPITLFGYLCVLILNNKEESYK